MPRNANLSVLLCAVAVAVALACAAPAGAAPYRPGEVVGAGKAGREHNRQPGVEYAVPNYVARATGLIPNDPGRLRSPGGWQQLQWNFLPGIGVDAPTAWQNLMAAGAPGGRGVVVAVLDTGVAYENRGRFLRSPDFSASRFVRGYDFVDRDSHPDDENGHGTHVAGTIAEGTNNSVGMTGLAYGARLMPVRVLDRSGTGGSKDISDGIRWAADHGARVINLSFEFGPAVTRSDIPDIMSALRHARSKGVLVVGAAGNSAAEVVVFPARSTNVLSVGATTSHRCLAEYSNEGSRLDLVAPGGGPDADIAGDADCSPPDLGGSTSGRPVYQMTLAHACGSRPSFRRFSIPSCFIGTSMAAPHVSATAALVIAPGILGRRPTPAALEARLEATATDLGAAGHDSHYGWGLV